MQYSSSCAGLEKSYSTVFLVDELMTSALVALCFSRGPRPVGLRNPKAFRFSMGGGGVESGHPGPNLWICACSYNWASERDYSIYRVFEQ